MPMFEIIFRRLDTDTPDQIALQEIGVPIPRRKDHMSFGSAVWPGLEFVVTKVKWMAAPRDYESLPPHHVTLRKAIVYLDIVSPS